MEMENVNWRVEMLRQGDGASELGEEEAKEGVIKSEG